VSTGTSTAATPDYAAAIADLDAIGGDSSRLRSQGREGMPPAAIASWRGLKRRRRTTAKGGRGAKNLRPEAWKPHVGLRVHTRESKLFFSEMGNESTA